MSQYKSGKLCHFYPQTCFGWYILMWKCSQVEFWILENMTVIHLVLTISFQLASHAGGLPLICYCTVLSPFPCPSVCQFVDVVDRKGAVPAWISLYVTNLLGENYVNTHKVLLHFTLNLLSYYPREKWMFLSPKVAVALTHQWGSLVAVTTMISSLKKVSCSELTALQSAKAFTRF